MSTTVSVLTGKPGHLVSDEKRNYFVLAPDENPGHLEVVRTGGRHFRRLIRSGEPVSLRDLGRRWGTVVAHDIHVPPGWVTLADLILTAFNHSGHDVVDWIRVWESGTVGQLVVHWDAARAMPYHGGVVAFAVALAAYVDPETGACGPVSDAGIPTWRRCSTIPDAEPAQSWGGYDADGRWLSRDDSVTGPAFGHQSAGSLLTAKHAEDGGIVITVKPTVAHALRRLTREHGVDGCASLVAEWIGLTGIDSPSSAS
jgi:hypothetical protein